MFLLMGISNKFKDCGRAENSVCPVCGAVGLLHVTNKYMTPHIFFIPIFRYDQNYLATCGSCASVMEITKERGRQLEKCTGIPLRAEDMRVVRNNSAPLCLRCGSRLRPDDAFCSQCGERAAP